MERLVCGLSHTLLRDWGKTTAQYRLRIIGLRWSCRAQGPGPQRSLEITIATGDYSETLLPAPMGVRSLGATLNSQLGVHFQARGSRSAFPSASPQKRAHLWPTRVCEQCWVASSQTLIFESLLQETRRLPRSKNASPVICAQFMRHQLPASKKGLYYPRETIKPPRLV